VIVGAHITRSGGDPLTPSVTVIDRIGNAGFLTLSLAGLTESTASAGSASLPAAPAGFLGVYIAGTLRKIPYYA
jgi:hypothetical protein